MESSSVVEETKSTNKRQFGVNKGVVSRAVVKFLEPPKPHPCTACFAFPSTFLTHKYVLEMIRLTLSSHVESFYVKSIQFVDRNTIHGAQGMDNRWLVTFDRKEAKEKLVAVGLTLFNRKLTVFDYDEILKEEYKEFIEYKKLKDKLFAKSEFPNSEINDTSAAAATTAAASTTTATNSTKVIDESNK
ncbi:hypothetical protein HELRODRAFT_179880 [Helobdella robusta]|uniref:Uncharacterized protein n=1 Tax=Helobdella robusta TaxID=6412 RepID=T1FF81_HELRO|nr:hypothetical protein HELRODRAFT_179880 [Helobdella robusta]ESN95022.1 hypothetical protein HELRODRAFT_179880 [Helobdella robusta]